MNKKLGNGLVCAGFFSFFAFFAVFVYFSSTDPYRLFIVGFSLMIAGLFGAATFMVMD